MILQNIKNDQPKLKATRGLMRERIPKPTAANPKIIINQEDGSGTAAATAEDVADTKLEEPNCPNVLTRNCPLELC